MVGRRKGTEKTGGRKAGTPNKVSGTVKEWIASIIDGNREQFEKDLEKLEPGERVRINIQSPAVCHSKDAKFITCRNVGG